MFTGIIVDLGTVVKTVDTKAGKRLVISTKLKGIRNGDSMAVSGTCLTVTDFRDGKMTFDAVPETLAKTTLGRLRKGHKVNLEPPLRAGDQIGGHFVLGHVDGRGTVLRMERGKKEVRLHVEVDRALQPFMIPKGSIAVEGVSLTLASLEGTRFSIALIPYTLKHTNLGRLKKGDLVNIETDMLGKYVLATRSSVDKELLQKAGFIE